MIFKHFLNLRGPFPIPFNPTLLLTSKVKRMPFLKAFQKVWKKTNWQKSKFTTHRLFCSMELKIVSVVQVHTQEETCFWIFWESSRECSETTQINVLTRQRSPKLSKKPSVGSLTLLNIARISLRVWDKVLSWQSSKDSQKILILQRSKKPFHSKFFHDLVSLASPFKHWSTVWSNKSNKTSPKFQRWTGTKWKKLETFQFM